MESIFALYIILGLLVLTGYIVYKLVPAFLRGAFFLLAIFGELDCLGIILYVICWITLPWIMAFLSIVFGLQYKPKSPTSKNSENPPSQPTPCE
jgi:Na+-transporting NADH:ubiquinone oxidoreductase subunit NqrB